MANFFQAIDLRTVLAFLTPILTIAAWMLDRSGAFSRIAKHPLSLSGNWRGWSIYRPVDLSSPSAHSDPETFFRLDVKLQQTFKRIALEETITDIYSASGKRLPDISARKFKGYGSVIGGINTGLVLDEIAGLTCGTMFLTLDTWGKELSGLGIIRNVDGKPVVVEILLVRHPSAPPELPALIKDTQILATRREPRGLASHI